MAADPTVPTCPIHQDRETRTRCPRCGRPVCDLCRDGETSRAELCPTCRAELAGAVSSGPSSGHGPPAAGRTTGAPPAPVSSGWRATPVTYGLLAAYVAVFAVGELSGGLTSRIAVDGAQINAAVLAGQWWRVLSATMLHAGLMHLAFNGYALYILGPQLERSVGSAAFLALYVAAGLAGGIAFLVGAPDQVAVGASGAIFGLFGAYIAAAWSNRDTPAGRAGLSQLGVLLAINLALPLIVPGIAWEAHVGGLVAGIVIGLAWSAGRRRHDRSASRFLAPPVVIVMLLLTGLLWYT